MKYTVEAEYFCNDELTDITEMIAWAKANATDLCRFDRVGFHSDSISDITHFKLVWCGSYQKIALWHILIDMLEEREPGKAKTFTYNGKQSDPL